MPTPILRNNVGTERSVTSANAVASGAYSNSADKLLIDNTTDLALLADFEFQPTFASAPVAGVVQLMAVDYALDNTTAGPAASASMVPRLVGTFSPQPRSGNASTTWRMRLNAVPVTRKTDFYVFNNGTAVSINTGSVLRARLWSPGA